MVARGIQRRVGALLVILAALTACSVKPVKQEEPKIEPPVIKVEPVAPAKRPTTVVKRPKYRGFNFLQHSAASFASLQAFDSLVRMRNTGANSAVFVPFLHQKGPEAVELELSDAVTDDQLIVGIRYAKSLGLQVILKPGILVDGSWTGVINPGRGKGWDEWFRQYHDHMLRFAAIAANERVDALVLGTELNSTVNHKGWPELIADVRAVFPGKLTYAAHGIEEIERFPHWNLLDEVAVTLYPSLVDTNRGFGDDPTPIEIRRRIEATLKTLHELAKPLKKPIWIMEIGIPSVEQALAQPWNWQRLSKQDGGPIPALDIQALALEQWFIALQKMPVEGVMVWCWYSDPMAGGDLDIDYTVQQKPAESVVTRYWATTK